MTDWAVAIYRPMRHPLTSTPAERLALAWLAVAVTGGAIAAIGAWQLREAAPWGIVGLGLAAVVVAGLLLAVARTGWMRRPAGAPGWEAAVARGGVRVGAAVELTARLVVIAALFAGAAALTVAYQVARVLVLVGGVLAFLTLIPVEWAWTGGRRTDRSKALLRWYLARAWAARRP